MSLNFIHGGYGSKMNFFILSALAGAAKGAQFRTLSLSPCVVWSKQWILERDMFCLRWLLKSQNLLPFSNGENLFLSEVVNFNRQRPPAAIYIPKTCDVQALADGSREIYFQDVHDINSGQRSRISKTSDTLNHLQGCNLQERAAKPATSDGSFNWLVDACSFQHPSSVRLLRYHSAVSAAVLRKTKSHSMASLLCFEIEWRPLHRAL